MVFVDFCQRRQNRSLTSRAKQDNGQRMRETETNNLFSSLLKVDVHGNLINALTCIYCPLYWDIEPNISGTPVVPPPNPPPPNMSLHSPHLARPPRFLRTLRRLPQVTAKRVLKRS
ncbi:hypothetical protein DPMN_038943 [Dreissena polymorpha]|uniref:Uncharacterized protein n=1 Tax=Dreissena polymorpha TaxID=45954 RepID=A0A9D4RR63_DREPO|nr:hypothetical protein DPMN_038943 [Dreissena polymorpha]